MHGSNGQLSRCRIFRIVRESAMSTGCSLRGKQLQQLGRLVGFRCYSFYIFYSLDFDVLVGMMFDSWF